MNKIKTFSRLMLLMAALIWGTSFVAQVVAMKYIEPFTFLFSRYTVGAVFITLLAVIFDYGRRRRGEDVDSAAEWKGSIFGGSICGTVMFFGISIQQFGLQHTQAGKAGFITALYIILVPLIEFALGKRFGKKTWFTTILGVTGVYLLSVKSGFTIGWGDLLILSSTIFWAGHILLCDRYSKMRSPIKLSAVQFIATALLCGIGMAVTEHPVISNVLDSSFPIFYTGFFCTGVAYTLQMAGQKNLNPVETSFILCTECLFALVGGYIVLGETLKGRELFGCVLLFAAVLIAQLPEDFGVRRSDTF